MSFEYKKEDRVATFIFNRPEAMNAMNLQLLGDFKKALEDFRDDDALWVGIVTGAGEKAFCAGADVEETLSFLKEKAHKMWAFPSPYRRVDMWKPLIAAINGFCLGYGLEIAMTCDIRVAGDKARFGFPEVTLGIIPGDGGSQRLTRMIPYCKAAEMLLTGSLIDAQEAHRLGLVNVVVPPEEVMPKAKGYAEKICKAAPLAVRAAKEAMIRGRDMPMEDGLRLEFALNSYLTQTEDHQEGRKAFLEKRKSTFKGR